MNVIRTETLSPAWFEAKWAAGEQNLTKRLEAILVQFPVVGVAALILISAAWHWLMHVYCKEYSMHFADRIWVLNDPAFFGITFFASVQLCFKPLRQVSVRSLAALLITVGALLTMWLTNDHGIDDVIAGIVMVWISIPLLLLALHAYGLISARALILSLILVFGVIPSVYGHFLTKYSVQLSEYWYMVWTDRLILPFSVVMSEVWQMSVTGMRLLDRRNLALVFNPVLFFCVLPFSHRHWKQEKPYEELLASALFSLTRLILLKIVDIQLEVDLILYHDSHPAWSGWTLVMAWLMYIQYFLYSYIGLHLGVSLGRCLGLSLENGTRFSLLAVSPLERWRRWNTYFYGWLFRFVFVPVYRRIRNLLLAIQIVFLVTLLLHDTRYLMSYPLVDHASRLFFVKLDFVFFQLHGLAVYVSAYFPKWTQDSSSKKGWWGVFGTHALMTGIHMLPLRF